MCIDRLTMTHNQSQSVVSGDTTLSSKNANSDNTPAVVPGVTRSGIVLYSASPEGTVFFCFGVDDKSGDYSDWSGGIESGETQQQTAVRELKEETLGYFDLRPEELQRSFYSTDLNTGCVIYFVRVDWLILVNFPYQYLELRANHKAYEMTQAKLLTYQHIVNMLVNDHHPKQFYSRIRACLTHSLTNLLQLCDFYKVAKPGSLARPSLASTTTTKL